MTQDSHSITVPNISKATVPIVLKLYIEPSWTEGRKVSSNSSGDLTNMAAMLIHGKNLYKSSSIEPVNRLHVALGTGVLPRLFK